MERDLDLNAAAGFLDPDLAEEFPGLRLDWLSADAREGGSPPEVTNRLRSLSNRYRGATVVAMRTHPIPSAYRTFYRQIGLDPDTTRIPSEQAAVERLMHGQFRSTTLVGDALRIALIETGVPVWALDADYVDAGGLGIRPSVAEERLGASEYSHHLAPGTLVVADAARVHGVLFDDVIPDHEPGPSTRRLVLFAVSVAGVPAIHVEEAMWVALEVLGTRGGRA